MMCLKKQKTKKRAMPKTSWFSFGDAFLEWLLTLPVLYILPTLTFWNHHDQSKGNCCASAWCGLKGTSKTPSFSIKSQSKESAVVLFFLERKQKSATTSRLRSALQIHCMRLRMWQRVNPTHHLQISCKSPVNWIAIQPLLLFSTCLITLGDKLKATLN